VLISDTATLDETMALDYLAALAGLDSSFALPSLPPSHDEQQQLGGEKAAVDAGVLADLSEGPQVQQSGGGGGGGGGKVVGGVIGALLAVAFVVGGVVIYKKREQAQHGMMMRDSGLY
jgi:hypothetical protein